MKKTKRIVALLLAGVMLLTGCGGGSGTTATTGAAGAGAGTGAATGEKKTVLNLALSENITKLDPHDIFNFPVYTACWMMYDTLIEGDHEGNYNPCLATEWSNSEDGLTWTFKLREGVKFQNGEDFNADDVVTTYQRLIDNPDLTCAVTYWPYLESVGRARGC